METSLESIMETGASKEPVATTKTTTMADTSSSSTEPLQNTENASRDGDFDNGTLFLCAISFLITMSLRYR